MEQGFVQTKHLSRFEWLKDKEKEDKKDEAPADKSVVDENFSVKSRKDSMLS